MHNAKLTDISGKNRGGWGNICEMLSTKPEKDSNNKNYCKI